MTRDDRPGCGRHLRLVQGDAGPAATLTDFLLDCIGEDEAAARDLGRLRGELDDPATNVGAEFRDGAEAVFLVGGLDPAVLLARCVAQREIVDRARECAARGAFAEAAILDAAVRALAVPYRDRPGYLEDWRP